MTLSLLEQTGSGFGNLILYGLGEPSGFVEANLADPISFFPQTFGWQLLALALLLYCSYRLIKGIKHWRNNRYRRDYIAQFPNLESIHFENELYHIMVVARTMANRANPNYQVDLFGIAWLVDMDTLCANDATLHNELGLQWMKVLTFERRKPLCFDERQQLLAGCEDWMLTHRNNLHDTRNASPKSMHGGQHGV